MSIGKLLAWILVGGLTLLNQLPVYAVIEEVVVVAQKRSESIQEVPISITVVTGQELEQRGLNDLQNLARFVPNIDVPRSNNSRNASVRIRGIGTSGSNPGIESSVGTFLDGIYMPTSAMSLGEFSDIQNVEILRGPQGTLYGRNTPVGAVNITTRRPVQEFESNLRLGAGNYGAKWINGYVGGGLSDIVSGRVSFYYRDLDGYENNRFLGNTANGAEDRGIRGRLLITASDSVEVNVTGFVTSTERNCCVAEQLDVTGPFGIATSGYLAATAANGYPFQNFNDHDHVVFADDEGDDEVDFWGASAQVDWTLANDFLLTSITGYQDWDNQVLIAADSLPQPVLSSNQNQHNKTSSQELRITSPSDEKIEYIAGLFLYRQDTIFFTRTWVGEGANRVFPFPPALCAAPCMFALGNEAAFQDFDQETKSVAVFGNMTFHISDVWDVTAGLRWSRDKKDNTMNYYNTPGTTAPFNRVFRENPIGDVNRTDKNTTWSLNSRYHFSNDVMGFVSVSTGFKSGGFNATRVPPGTPVEFEDEQSISYEAGIKSMLLDRLLQLNATLYWTILEDFQESSFNQASGSGFIVTNAGERVSKGLEAELVATPADGLRVTAALAYLKAEYTEWPNAQCGAGETPDNAQGTCDRSDDVPAFAPEWKYTVGADYTRRIGSSNLQWRARADYAWVDEQNLIRVTIDPPGERPAYGVLNLGVAVGTVDGQWEVSAFAHNALDEAYFLQANAQPGGALMSNGGVSGAGGFSAWYGPPRTVGLQLTWKSGM